MKKWVNRGFVLLFFLILACGFLKTALFPKDINYYENRYAHQLPPVTASGFLDKSLQKDFDRALMDQIPLAQHMKKTFHTASTILKTRMLEGLLQVLPSNQYVNLGSMHLFGGIHYVYLPVEYEENVQRFAPRIANINQTISLLADVPFYLYYIEKETDLDFTTGEKKELGSRILDAIELPQDQKGIFTIDSFQQFDAEFFRTDTHWNYLGSYRGYREVLELVMPDEIPMEPGQPQLVCRNLSGNKATTSGAGGIWVEDFYAYPYSFPEMTCTINATAVADYGAQNQFDLDSSSYGSYYGGDDAQITFHNPTGNGENLLLIGESYDNAILKLLASHCSNLYSVDLRNYETLMGQPFFLDRYIQEHDIHRVLLIGNVDYFRSEDFHLEVSGQ